MLVCCKRGEGSCSSLLLFPSYCNTCSGGKEELRRKIEDILDRCYCLFSLFYFRSASKKSLLTPPASYLPLIHSIDWRKLIRLGDFQVDFNFPDPEERSQILWEHRTGGKGSSYSRRFHEFGSWCRGCRVRKGETKPDPLGLTGANPFSVLQDCL